MKEFSGKPHLLSKVQFYHRNGLVLSTKKREEIPDLRDAALGRSAEEEMLTDGASGRITSYFVRAANEFAADVIDQEMQGKGHVKEE